MVTRKLNQEAGWLPKGPCKPKEAATADLDHLKNIFLSPPKFVVGTTVHEEVYLRLLEHPGGISGFYTEAVQAFDGDLEALVRAAAAFDAIRKSARKTMPVRAANGRVTQEVHDKIRGLEDRLRTIRGWSRSKVLAGLVHLKLNAMN